VRHICLSSIDWSMSWQLHHELATRLAGAGEPVLFVETTGVRPPAVRDWRRMAARLAHRGARPRGERLVQANLWVQSPVLLPFPYSGPAGRLNRAAVTRSLTRWLAARGGGETAVWTFLPTPLARDVIGALRPDASIYWCADDFRHSSPAARGVRESEDRLLREADLVLVTSASLRQRAAAMRDRVYLCPPGVDYPLFEAEHRAGGAMPPELQGLPRPVLGYLGSLHRWVDLEILQDVARTWPTASLVVVGPPAAPGLASLARFPNVHLLGARPHDQVPRYLRGFDVGLIPYRLDDYTASVAPTKLYEYLAMGLPVVSVALPEVSRLAAESGDLVEIARDRPGFGAAIRRALGTDTPAARRRRIAVARGNGWDARFAFVRHLVASTLAARRAAPGRGPDSLGGGPERDAARAGSARTETSLRSEPFLPAPPPGERAG
jgi:glycosyltransferase involved in cell wall biosynthesis